MPSRSETYSLDKDVNKGNFTLAVLGNEANDAVAFFGEIDRIGMFVDNFIKVVIESLSTIHTALDEYIL